MRLSSAIRWAVIPWAVIPWAVIPWVMVPWAMIPWSVAVLLALPASAQTAAVRDGAEDAEAFRMARATADPRERFQNLLQFRKTYPESALRPRATELALETVLRSSPGRTDEVHMLAAEEIADAPPGLERTLEEARVADALASAEPAGADLPAAQGWAEMAVAALTEERFRRETTAEQRHYRLPPLSAREVHRNFEHDRVLCLAALANVELREEKPERAAPLLAEASRLDPLSGEVNALEGQFALQRHQDGVALAAFERAEATGALAAPWHAQALRLYEAGGGAGGERGLDATVDALYSKLMPAVFTLPPRTLPAGGHTVLLELFTGSGCEPCMAPDLAIESLLTTYGRQDLAVLEYDENIPRPDPLTTPASESRAAVYRVGSTPEAFLDGDPLPVAGSARSDVENVVVGFAEEIEAAATRPAPVRLRLAATQATGVVATHAAVSVAPGATASALPGRVVVHTALVQDAVRYSGENGVRFHRMVVRAMGPDTALRLPGGLGSDHAAGEQAAGKQTAGEQTIDAAFDLKAVEGMARSYLDLYEQRNDRFGEVRFRTKDLPLDPAHLGVIVWVQDVSTNAVLQAVYVAVPVSVPEVR